MGGEEAGEALAGHREDELRLVEVGAGDLGGDLAVAEHGGAVADREHLGQAVGDVEHGDALGLEAAEDAEERGDLGAGERGGGLVEHEDARAVGEGAGDHHEVALGGGERGDDGAGVHRQAEVGEDGAGPGFHRAAVDEDALAEAGAAGEDILGDGELFEDLDFLRDVDDAGGGGLGGGGEADRLAGKGDAAGEGAGGVDAVEDLDERRLAGAVLAEERVDLAGADGDVDAAERGDAAEALGDGADLEEGLGHGVSGGSRRPRAGPAREGLTARRCRGWRSRGRGRRR